MALHLVQFLPLYQVLYSLWEHADALDQVLIGVFVLRHHLPWHVEDQTTFVIAPRSLPEVFEIFMKK